jgi:hypothetical protein
VEGREAERREAGGRVVIRGVPYDAEVEYLESTGTQYINTGVLPANNMSFDTAMMFTELTTGDHAVLGSRSSSARLQIAQVYGRKWTVGIGGSYDGNGSAVSANTFYQLHGEVSNGKTVTLSANGSQCSTLTTTGGIPTIPVYTLARNRGTYADANSKARIYSMKIYVSSVLVRDYIPVRFTNELGQSEGAMYDKVSKQLFRNKGTGSFKIGPDKI